MDTEFYVLLVVGVVGAVIFAEGVILVRRRRRRIKGTPYARWCALRAELNKAAVCNQWLRFTSLLRDANEIAHAGCRLNKRIAVVPEDNKDLS